MDINWLEDFVCFARLLNFTKAAQERNITQSAFSRRIQSLEYWAGTDLIDRKTYPARLSATGEEFLPIAKSVLTQLYRTRDDLRAKANKGQKLLRFAAPHSVSIHILTPMLQQFEQTVPGLQTRVMSDDLHTCCDFLSEGLCEFLMCYRHSHIPLVLDEQRFERIDLGKERLVPVCVPDVSDGLPRWNLDAEDTQSISFLSYVPGSFLGAVVEYVLSNNKCALEPRHTDTFTEAIKSLTTHGVGLAWLPEFSIQNELNDGALVHAGGDRWATTLTLSVYTERENLSANSEAIWQRLQAERMAEPV